MAGRLNTSWFWQDVRESLLAQPIKTGLTFMAVSVGMLALTILLAILAGLQQRAHRQVSEIGADVVILAGTGTDNSGAALNRPMVDRLRQLAPGSPCAGVRYTTLRDILPAGPVLAIAADEDFAEIRGWHRDDGRWLDAHDRDHASLHTVVSRGVADRLFLKVGDLLVARETLLRVVGIAHGSGSHPGNPQTATDTLGEYFFWISPSTPVGWMNTPASRLAFDAIHVKNRTYPDLGPLVDRIHRDLEPERIPRAPAWTIITPDSLIASTRAMMKTVRLVYGSVAGLCLLLGGATLTSLMMVAIQQRIGEIGLRMAIGASWRDIFFLFLCEGLITTIAAGVLGIGMGLGFLYLLADSAELPVAWNARVVLLPLAASVLLGIIFSWYPARTAATITPADALRND